MRKIPRTSFLVDKLHKGVVCTMIGLTLYGTALIGHRVFRYFTVIKPTRETEEFKMLQDEHIDALVDKAPKLGS